MESSDHRLDLGVLSYSIFAHFSTMTRILVASEGALNRQRVVCVYPNYTSFQTLSDIIDLIQVFGEYSGSKPIVGVVGTFNNLLQIFELHQLLDRPEYLENFILFELKH